MPIAIATDTGLAIAMAIGGGAVTVILALVLFILNATRGDVQSTAKKIDALHPRLDVKADKAEVAALEGRVDGAYEWADKRFVTKETCKIKHEHDSGRQPAVAGGG